MLEDINQHLVLIDDAMLWAKEFGKDSFPFDVFKDYRRKLKRINSALQENCSAAAYGESQVGKSYLMSSLLSSPKSPFVIKNAEMEYSFIDDINPSGGNNAKIESTGVITRFTIRKGSKSMKDYIKIRNLSIVDIILLLSDSYYNDIKINQDSVLKYDVINKELEKMSNLWSSHTVEQSEIDEDDIRDIIDYMRDVIGNSAANVNHSNFGKYVAPRIKYISYDKWVEVFGLLWNRNSEINRLFNTLINEYKKLNFQMDVYVPFEAVLRDNGSLLKIDWLDTVCGVQIDTGNDKIYTDVYDSNGDILAYDFNKGSLSAIIAELTFELPPSVSNDRNFLHKLDLLDFPGARSREKYREQEIQSVLPKILRRGKVAYLFNKYSRSLRINSVLFCHHNDQKTEATIGEAINCWIEDNIGSVPSERAEMLRNTNGIAPLFLVATKFNIDLERTKTDNSATLDKLDAHWNRFNTVLPEIIKPYKWLDNWVTLGGIFNSSAFQNIYPLRDFYWSAKNKVFDGYSDGVIKSEESNVHIHPDYPDYFENLKISFKQNDFIKKHFSDPEQAWNDVATINNDGSKAIIQNLDAIADVLEEARNKKYLAQLETIKDEMSQILSVYFEPEDKEEKNLRVKQISSDIRRSLILNVGENPEIFGCIIDTLMVPINELRDIAYDIIVCHTDTPKDFSMIHFIRKQVDINTNDSIQDNIQKLCDYFGCDATQLEKDLSKKDCSIIEIVSGETETLSTVAEVVSKHIIDYWTSFINNKVKVLDSFLPHSENVVFMLAVLLKKMELKKKLSERIDGYRKIFSEKEQPDVIAGYASLLLNNFVSTVGCSYLNENEIEIIRQKSELCQIVVNLSPLAWERERRPQPLLQVLNAFDDASHIDRVSKSSLMKLPLWESFQRWENQVTIGLLYASDISQVDPVANARMKYLLTACNSLYKN